MVAVPAATPVTRPEAETVATLVLEEVQVPPVVALFKVVVPPAHTVAVPVIGGTTGAAVTVTVVLLDPVQPLLVTV